MSLQDYSVAWSDALIGRVETHLRDLHSAIHQYYESSGYETAVDDRAAATNKEEDGDTATAAAASTLDVVSPAGSFLLRTCVHATPFANLHAERGVGADLVITMPTAKCSQVDLQEGRYLACRHRFVEEMETCLNRLIQGAAKKVAAAKARKQAKRPRDTGSDSDAAAAEEEEAEKADDGQTVANMAAAERLSRMTVRRMPIHACYGNSAKDILRVRFLRRRDEANSDGGFHQRFLYETFYVDLHFRPAQHAGRVTSAAATRKHPYYSYLILEDYMMPMYLKRIHKMCVEADGLRRALVILKCWAHHTGLMASASGHQEGLNGFVIACMLLKLLEDGILTNATSEENATRAVWIRLSHGYFLPASRGSSGGSKGSGAVVPAAEERGDVATLRLSGEVMNVLFRSSAEFFKSVVQRAAEEALAHPVAADVFQRTPFQRLQLRYDVALTLRNAMPKASGRTEAAGAHDDSNDEDEEAVALAAVRHADAIRKPTVFMSPLVLKVKEVCTDILRTALTNRASFVSAWPAGPRTVHVIVQLTTEPDGRNHLTRGPAIEDADAVAAFNAFWGMNKTSTRQFPDGAIYRCVLWTFPEIVGGCATSALSASTVTRTVAEYAIRKHANPATEVSVLLGGLEGFLAERIGAEWRDASHVMQRSLREASLAVQKAIANLPRAVLPCKVTEFCVIAASERNTEVFPVRPHFALTHTTDALEGERYVGLSTAATVEPIHCVMAIDDKGKIPDTLEAIAIMKGAICAQLAKYVQQHHQSSEQGGEDAVVIRAFASSQSVDLICRGYLFRVYIGHYREVSLLRALKRDAEANLLEQKLFWTSQHTKFISSVAYGHHSYANAVRLAKRWMSAMMLYEFVSPEAVELLVANAYLAETGSSTSTSTTGTTSTVTGAPRTPVSGFIRFLQLLASHDWKHALVLPFTDDEKDPTTAARKLLRKPAEHQAMYIAAPYAPTESPFTLNTPRPMILHRLVQLAKGVLALLLSHLSPQRLQQLSAEEGSDRAAEAEVERAMFTSDPVAFDLSMCFHPQLVLQPDRSITVRFHGGSDAGGDAAHASGVAGGSGSGRSPNLTSSDPSAADAAGSAAAAFGSVAPGVANSKTLVRLRQLDELEKDQSREYLAALVEREPAAHAVRTVRAALRDKGMVFFDALAPTAVYIVGVTAAPLLKKSQAMHEEVLRVSRGALLPAPPCAFTRIAPVKAAVVRGDGDGKRKDGSGGKGAGMDAGDAQSLITAAKSHQPHTSDARKLGGKLNRRPQQQQHAKAVKSTERSRDDDATTVKKQPRTEAETQKSKHAKSAAATRRKAKAQ